MRLSVIVPCFNVAPFVERAIRSADFADCEIIAVNDGSADETLAVLRALSREVSNLNIIDQKNAGASAARNAGLAIAKGEYIAFLDGDDFFEKGALARLFALADETGADIVFGDFNYFYDNSNLKSPAKNYVCAEGLIDKDKYFADFCTGRNSALPAVWGKIIKSNLIKERGLKFLEGVFVAEDVNFSAKAIFHARKIAKLNAPALNYRIGVNNASKAFNFKHFADARACADDLREYFSKFELSAEQAAQISAHNLILRYAAALTLTPFSFADYERAARFATADIAAASAQSGFTLLPRRLQILIKTRALLGFALYSKLLAFALEIKNLVSNLKSNLKNKKELK